MRRIFRVLPGVGATLVGLAVAAKLVVLEPVSLETVGISVGAGAVSGYIVASVLRFAIGLAHGASVQAASGNDGAFASGPSVNIDGSPMCGSVDIHGNPYGVRSDQD